MKKITMIYFLIGSLVAAFFTSALCANLFATVLADSVQQFETMRNDIMFGMFGFSIVAGIIGFVSKAETGRYAYTLLTGTVLQFNGNEVRKAIMKPVYKDPDITSMHKIVEGITTKTQVIYFGEVEEVTIVDEGCGSEPQDNAIPFKELFWDPTELEAWVKECYTNLKGYFMEWGLKTGYKRADLTLAQTGDDPANFWDEFVLSLMMGAWKKDQFRMAWFSDKASTTAALGGYLTGAGRVKHFNQGDGFWKKIFAAVAANEAYRYTIARNVNYADQSLLTDDALKALKAMHNNGDERIFDVPGAHFRLTRSMYTNLLDSYESKAPEIGFQNLVNGQKALHFRNVPVMQCSMWDRVIKKDQRDPASTANYFRPHRAALYAPENLQIGWSVGDNDVFESWYERTPKEVHMRGNVDFDTQLPHGDLVAAAY